MATADTSTPLYPGSEHVCCSLAPLVVTLFKRPI
jgi:hypothetical protein